MAPKNPQIESWAGEFGDAYTARNSATEQQIHIRLKVLVEIFRLIEGDRPLRILECGCNIGLNTRAMRRFTDAELFAVEPNATARSILQRQGVLDEDHVKDAVVQSLPFPDRSMDLVFTSGVLIHVHPDDLPTALDEMARVSSKYLMMIEYFSQSPQPIPYRGRDDLLWKRDFGSDLMDRHPSLVPLGSGFFWRRTTGFDDATWWLFRKP